MTWELLRALAGRVDDRNDLIEGFAFADHAQVGTRSLFSRVHALLEIDYLGVQRGIALAQRVVQGALVGYGSS